MIPQVFEPMRRIIRGLSARATLPIYELDRAHVETKGSRIRPFVLGRGFTKDPLCSRVPVNPVELFFSGWRLAHAVKKADCLRQIPYEFVQRLGFFLEQLPALDWRRGNLRLLSGVASAYADFTRSSLAGRIGQGIAILFMDSHAFPFSAHYPRAAETRGPDFIFEGLRGHRSRVLVEAKGAFAAPGDQPNIKGILAEGLAQISVATKSLGSAKSYVIGSFLRENGDTGDEPSLVAFVDPENANSSQRDDTPRDVVLRHNYAAWLDAMNLHYFASNLRSRSLREASDYIQLRVLKLNGVEFGVVPIGAFPADDLDDLPHHWHWRNGRFVVAGLPMQILDRLCATLSVPSTELTIDSEGVLPTDFSLLSEFDGSVLRDGSLLGLLSAESIRLAKPVKFPW